MSYQVVESAADSLAIDPDLPLSRSAVPRLAGVVPAVQAKRIVESIQGVSVHRHGVVRGAIRAGHPR